MGFLKKTPPVRKMDNNRTFAYQAGEAPAVVSLSFTLSPDKKEELSNFLELLDMAKEDVQKALDDLVNKPSV